ELWVGCIAGALEEKDFAAKLRVAGFSDVEIDTWRVYKIDDARQFLSEAGVDVDAMAPQVEGKFASAFIRARKPEAKSCCGTEGCSRSRSGSVSSRSRARSASPRRIHTWWRRRPIGSSSRTISFG